MPLMPLTPVIDIIAVGTPFTEMLAAGVLILCDIVVAGNALAARSVAGVIVVVVGIMMFMPMGRCMVVMGMPMDMGWRIDVIGMAMDCGIIIRGIIIPPPPGGLAAALPMSPRVAHVARTMRTTAENVRNIAFLLPNGA